VWYCGVPLPESAGVGKVTIAVVGVTLLFLIFADQIVSLWTDWPWFGETH
jgi:hypothetical protein